MAGKANAGQDDAKKKAAEIAKEARAARPKKAAEEATPAPEPEVKPEGEKDEKDEEEQENDKLIIAANTSEEVRSAVNAESAKSFKDSSEDVDMFLRRTIHIPGRRALRKAFEREEIVGDEFGEYEDENSQKELEYQLLSDSAKAKKPKRLLGRVRGIEPVLDSDEKVISYEAKVSFIPDPADPKTKELIKKKEEPASIYSVYIPAPMFFFYRRPELFEGPDGQRNLLRIMKNKVGALVEFVVYDISPDNDRVIGSRIRAMQLKAYDYYLDPRSRRKEGDKLFGRITETGVNGITVEVCGAETFIQNSELSWLHINNAKSEEQFKVGKTVPVIVKSVEVGKIKVANRDTQYVAITASVREATEKPLAKYGSKYQIGGTYQGIVQYRLPEGKYIVRIDNRIEAICYPPDFGTPRVGAECSVYVKDKNEEGLVGNFAYF